MGNDPLNATDPTGMDTIIEITIYDGKITRFEQVYSDGRGDYIVVYYITYESTYWPKDPDGVMVQRTEAIDIDPITQNYGSDRVKAARAINDQLDEYAPDSNVRATDGLQQRRDRQAQRAIEAANAAAEARREYLRNQEKPRQPLWRPEDMTPPNAPSPEDEDEKIEAEERN